MSGVIRSMRAPFCRSTGLPYFTIVKTMTQYARLGPCRPVAEHLDQAVDSGALRAADIITARRHPHQDTGGILEAEKLPQTEPGVEMVSGAGRDERLLHIRP